MTTAQQILRIIASGGPQSVDGLALVLGMPTNKVRYTVEYLRERGHISPNPKTYSVTPKGTERAKYEPKVPVTPKARKPRPPRKAEDTVSHAMRTRPALATVWGVSA